MELAAGDSAAGCANCSAEKIRTENGKLKMKIKKYENLHYVAPNVGPPN